jgi:hypothetical protein
MSIEYALRRLESARVFYGILRACQFGGKIFKIEIDTSIWREEMLNSGPDDDGHSTTR